MNKAKLTCAIFALAGVSSVAIADNSATNTGSQANPPTNPAVINQQLNPSNVPNDPNTTTATDAGIANTTTNPATSGVPGSDTSMQGDPKECQISGHQGQIAPETDPTNCHSFICCQQGNIFYWVPGADCSVCTTVTVNGKAGVSAYFQNCWDNGALDQLGNPVVDCNAGN